ncbi:hypothetical protein E2542_SST26085 [Spatholobus suberectus]|nr:hypothetical protein E2542_SST26085 [Spatholobus suberectus]
MDNEGAWTVPYTLSGIRFLPASYTTFTFLLLMTCLLSHVLFPLKHWLRSQVLVLLPFQIIESNSDGGFLKLSRTQEWVLGDMSAPINKKALINYCRSIVIKVADSLLFCYCSSRGKYCEESVGIGLACSGYCLITLSIEEDGGKKKGILNLDIISQCSCLYLQLFYQHADNLSSETVPQIFTKGSQRSTNQNLTGIRSEDLQDLFALSIMGCIMSLSSPRLVIPATIFGLWVLSRQHFTNNFFDFQLVPAMFGMCFYKPAVLVQVYRDNEDLKLVFSENIDGSTD